MPFAVMGLIISTKPPSRGILLEAEHMGMASWVTARQYRRLQIRTVQELLDEKRSFEIPDSCRSPRVGGLGRRLFARLIAAVRGDQYQISNDHGHVNGWVMIDSVDGTVGAVDD